MAADDRSARNDPPDRAAAGVTLAQLAEAKRIPEAFLRSLGWRDDSYRSEDLGEVAAISMPYWVDRPGGRRAFTRKRIAIAGDKFRQPAGRALDELYGRWRLEEARTAGWALVVEGETDAATAWHGGVPAVGIPGASAWRDDWSAQLEGIADLYVVEEPDQGGRAFVERLAGSPLQPRLRVIRLEAPAEEIPVWLAGRDDEPRRVKDVSDLWLAVDADPQRFGAEVERAIAGAQTVDPPPPAPLTAAERTRAEAAAWAEQSVAELEASGELDADPGLLSAEPAGPSGRNLRAAFRTAAELVAELPEQVDWCWRSYLARGAVTELVGRAKAAGKTTLLAYLVRAVVAGDEFLDQPTRPTPIVFLTEQPPVSLRAVLERAGLGDCVDLRILLWRDTRGATWAEIVEAALAECAATGAELLIVDTLPAFAGIRGDAENDAGAALVAIEPLQVAAAAGLAVLVVRHERKGGGDVGESARGSSAFTGAVDIVLRLARQDNPVRPTIRVLSALSRFDETPPELVIELTDEGYVSLGEEAAVAFAEARQGLLSILPDAPDRGLTVPEIVEAGGGRRATVQAAIKVLEASFQIERVGGGRRGDPHRFRRIAAGGSAFVPVSAETPSAETNGFLSAGRPPYGGRGVSGREAAGAVPRTVGEELAAIFEPAEPADLPFFADIDVLDAGALS